VFVGGGWLVPTSIPVVWIPLIGSSLSFPLFLMSCCSSVLFPKSKLNPVSSIPVVGNAGVNTAGEFAAVEILDDADCVIR
jgi:hypothetical protein